MPVASYIYVPSCSLPLPRRVLTVLTGPAGCLERMFTVMSILGLAGDAHNHDDTCLLFAKMTCVLSLSLSLSPSLSLSSPLSFSPPLTLCLSISVCLSLSLHLLPSLFCVPLSVCFSQ